MTVETFKHGGKFDWLGKMFYNKGPTFESLMTIFIGTIYDLLYDQLEYKLGEELKMPNLPSLEDNIFHLN